MNFERSAYKEWQTKRSVIPFLRFGYFFLPDDSYMIREIVVVSDTDYGYNMD